MTEILLYGVIGEPYDGLDAKTVVTAIHAAEGDLAIRINSPGGYVMEGLAIIEALRSYASGRVVIYIDGLAASMASAIAMIGAETIMAESALMMIHKPWDASIGNAEELRKDAAKLDRIEAQLIGIYAGRTGLPEGELAAMLAAETWFDAEQALAGGFVTSISSTLKLAALADVSACGFRHPPALLKGPAMPNATPMAAAEVTEIRALVAAHALPESVAVHIFRQQLDMAAARAHILDQLAARSDSAQIGLNVSFMGGESFANPAFHAKAVADALYARMSGKPAEGAAAELIGMSMVDMAREMLELRGVRNARRMRPMDVLDSAAWNRNGGGSGQFVRADITHTSSDFPDLLQAVGQRFLMDQYQAFASPLKQVARERSARDFRTLTGIDMSAFGTLPLINEAGEIRHGTFSTSKESYQLQTFAKQFSLTRQAMINDDLAALSDPLRIMARAASETEATVLAALINSNPVMSDGVAVFHATHGNLAAAGAAPSVTSLDAARLAMRSQKDLDKTTPINAQPKFIVSSPGAETAIEKLVSNPITPAQVDNVNPFAGKLVPLVDPRLTGTAWYLFADPNFTPGLEYAYLDGQGGPNVESNLGWDVLGTSYRVYMDFGAGVMNYRGMYKVPATS